MARGSGRVGALAVGALMGVAFGVSGCSTAGGSATASGSVTGPAASEPSGAVGSSVGTASGGASAQAPVTSGSSAAGPSRTASGGHPATSIPAGLRLPHQGVKGPGAETSDWRERPWTFRPCGDQGATIDLGAALDRRSIEQTGPEYSAHEAVAVFADANAATGFANGLVAEAKRCAGEDHPTRAVVQPLAGAWGQGWSVTVFGQISAVSGPKRWMTTQVLMVARTGSGIAVVDRGGELAAGAATVDPALVRSLRGPLDQLAPKLCAFTVAGCRA